MSSLTQGVQVNGEEIAKGATESLTDDIALAEQLADAKNRMVEQIGKRVIGQKEVIEHLMIILFSRGHGLFVGVPGLAKTLLIHTLAEVIDLEFNRIQFTPDLMPADITGTDIIEQSTDGSRHFRFVKGPVFCNILLADEINRTPPKTQAALLQSMQEKMVTAGGKTYPLPPPFHVFATQNPIEQEGTYPLPEAQLDRFMMMLNVDYPSATEEIEVVQSTTNAIVTEVSAVLKPSDLIAFQDLVLRVPIADSLVKMAVSLVRKSRPKDDSASAEIREYVAYGAGPRASQHLVLASKARAILSGRKVVDKADIIALAAPVMRHRMITNFHADAKAITTDHLIQNLIASVN